MISIITISNSVSGLSCKYLPDVYAHDAVQTNHYVIVTWLTMMMSSPCCCHCAVTHGDFTHRGARFLIHSQTSRIQLGPALIASSALLPVLVSGMFCNWGNRTGVAWTASKTTEMDKTDTRTHGQRCSDLCWQKTQNPYTSKCNCFSKPEVQQMCSKSVYLLQKEVVLIYECSRQVLCLFVVFIYFFYPSASYNDSLALQQQKGLTTKGIVCASAFVTHTHTFCWLEGGACLSAAADYTWIHSKRWFSSSSPAARGVLARVHPRPHHRHHLQGRWWNSGDECWGGAVSPGTTCAAASAVLVHAHTHAWVGNRSGHLIKVPAVSGRPLQLLHERSPGFVRSV